MGHVEASPTRQKLPVEPPFRFQHLLTLLLKPSQMAIKLPSLQFSYNSKDLNTGNSIINDVVSSDNNIYKQMAKMVDTKKESVTFRATSKDEEGRKRVEKVEVHTHDPDTLRHTEKKLIDKGVLRQDRHPVDGRGPVHKPPPKSGHGGKFTWEGPDDFAANELEAPTALDSGDPNFVDDEERRARDAHEEAEAGIVVGEVEVAKAAEDRAGVARVEVSPPLELNAV